MKQLERAVFVLTKIPKNEINKTRTLLSFYNFMGKVKWVLVGVIILAFVGVGLWLWRNANKARDGYLETYSNNRYRFQLNLPIEMKGKYEVDLQPVDSEVGQIDSCKDCALIQFVTLTEDKKYCAFPGECGKSIAFVIWVRDTESWNKNNVNKSYACIDEANVVKKTEAYVYTLCPFSVQEAGDIPNDTFQLLQKALPTVKTSFASF